MNKELQEMAETVVELATTIDKLASANEALEAQVQTKPSLDASRVAAALDKCAAAGVILPKEKAGFAARIAQEPEFALLLVEKTAEKLNDRVSPTGSLVGQVTRSAKDPYDAEFGS